MGVIYDVSRFILHLLCGYYTELNEPASSLCPTQCLSNMPIGLIDWVKIYRSHGCLPKPHSDKSSRVSVVVDKRCRCRIYRQREPNYKKKQKTLFQSDEFHWSHLWSWSGIKANSNHTGKFRQLQKQIPGQGMEPRVQTCAHIARLGTCVRMLIA